MPFLALAMSQIDASHLSRPMGESSDRKSTRLNSSHGYISYAVFCLKKKKSNACINRIYSVICAGSIEGDCPSTTRCRLSRGHTYHGHVGFTRLPVVAPRVKRRDLS